MSKTENVSKFHQYTEDINGTKYTFQFPGFRQQQRILDDARTDENKLLLEDFTEEMFEHIVVDPKVSFEYFDEHPEDFKPVREFAQKVLMGENPYEKKKHEKRERKEKGE